MEEAAIVRAAVPPPAPSPAPNAVAPSAPPSARSPPPPTPPPQRRRLDRSKLTYSAFKDNPIYAIFTFAVLYCVFRLVVTFLWPVVRPSAVKLVLFYTKNLYVDDAHPMSTLFHVVRYVWVIMHFLFEKIIYYFVCGWFLDYVVVVLLAIFVFMYCIWCVWKYILQFPLKDILGAILKAMPPFSYTWDMFDQFDGWLREDTRGKLASTVRYVGGWMGLVGDEGMALVEGGAGGAGDGIEAPPEEALTKEQATLKKVALDCRDRYQPYAFSDPFSQAMVRNEMTKCELRGLSSYYSTIEPDVAKAMAVCETTNALAARRIPADEFVSTASLLAAVRAYGNRWGIDEETGAKVLRDKQGDVVATELDDGVVEVRNAVGMRGYLDGGNRRVMPSGDGGYVPLSRNMEDAVSKVGAAATDAATAADPVSELIKKEDAFVACQIAAMRATAKASYAADMSECADAGDAVADPAENSAAAWGAYGSAVGAKRSSVGHCQSDKLKDLKRGN